MHRIGQMVSAFDSLLEVKRKPCEPGSDTSLTSKTQSEYHIPHICGYVPKRDLVGSDRGHVQLAGIHFNLVLPSYLLCLRDILCRVLSRVKPLFVQEC